MWVFLLAPSTLTPLSPEPHATRFMPKPLGTGAHSVPPCMLFFVCASPAGFVRVLYGPLTHTYLLMQVGVSTCTLYSYIITRKTTCMPILVITVAYWCRFRATLIGNRGLTHCSLQMHVCDLKVMP